MSSKSPSPGATTVKHNGRLGSKKSKTGCLTCKARKVKCTEERPSCRRCINAGRECQGYADVFVSTQILDVKQVGERLEAVFSNLVRTPSKSPSPPPSITSDSRALHYYRTTVAELLGGAVDTEFWTRTILQLSEAEPPIKQALIAVSNVFEMQAQNNPMDLAEAERRSTEAYTKALAATAQRVAEPDAEVVALATCVLFLCLHCLQGDRDKAVMLLRSGSGVMRKLMRTLQNPDNSGNTAIAEMFLPIFERMILLLRMFGEAHPHIRDQDEMLSENFEDRLSHLGSLEEARVTLHWLVHETHDLIITGRPQRHEVELDEEHMQVCLRRQGMQLAAYSSWMEGFEKLLADPAGTFDERAIVQLRLTYVVSLVWLSTALDAEEETYDKYLPEFQTICKEAAHIIAGGTPLFQLEMGVIPPLYFTALRCRDPSTRLRAQELLQQAPAKEGLWNREEALRVVRRVVNLEMTQNQFVGKGVKFQNAKICDSRTRYTDEEGTHVTFHAKQDGSRDMWMIWEECIPLWYHASMEQLEQPLHTLLTQKGVN